MKLTPSTHCPARSDWRNWLKKNHATQTEVWLHFYKKHTGKPSVTYRESVEEALCFGWIDGIRKRVDDERYAQRFTPRKKNSKWSPLNISLAEKMIDEGRMTGAGLAAFEQRLAYDEAFLQQREQTGIALPDAFREALEANPVAREHFMAMAPGYRRQYVGWIMSAKRAATRARRIVEAVRLLEQNKKPGMK